MCNAHQVSNLGGEYLLAPGPHSHTGEHSTLGLLRGAYQPRPGQFRKKNTGTMGSNSLPRPRPFNHSGELRKADVPCACERPVMGLRTKRNYIVSNAVENILALPRQPPTEVDWLRKKDYGRTP
jgi:hypothetical protein